MTKPFQLLEKELHYLQDTDFLTTKHKLMKSLQGLLEQSRQRLQEQKESLQLPAPVWKVPPKISRGENYEWLPYLVLDYPRIFQQEATFAYRTMFWWGWGFSCTLHLGGAYWRQCQQPLLQKLEHTSAEGWWVCVNKSPWEYHFRPDNYRPLQEVRQQEGLEVFAKNPFFKLSRRLPLERYQELPSFSLETLQQAADFLKK